MSGLNKRIARARGQVLTVSTPARVLSGVCENTGATIPAKELCVRVQALASLVTDAALKALPGHWNETGFTEFDKSANVSYAYKALEQVLGHALYINGTRRTPGRARRIAGEILGRQIRAGVHRRKVFKDLLEVSSGNLKYSEAKGTHVEKRNLSRQINKYTEKTGIVPGTFFELNPVPPEHIKATVLLSVADSQQCQWLGLNENGDKLLLRILLPPIKGKKWSWCVLSIGVNKQVIDAYDSTSLCLPTLRVKKDKIYADITLDTLAPEPTGNKRVVLGVDWGSRRLATASVVKEENDTISTDGRAYFFNAGPWHDKDRRRRVQGEQLWAKAQHKRLLAQGLKDSNPVKEKLLKDAQDLTRQMRDVNAKRARANRELARLLAVTAVSWAKVNNAGAVAGEDLSSMEPTGDRKRRSILSQRLRGQISTALSGACAKAGLEFMQVNAQNTSSICPQCPDTSWLIYNKVKGQSTSGYAWARCKNCNKSWDRDVVGSLNIGTRYLKDPKSAKRLKKVGHIKGAGVKDLGGIKRIRSKKPVPAPQPRYVKSRTKTGPTPKNTPGESTRGQHLQVSGATINQPAVTAGERVYPSGRPTPPRPGARAPIIRVVHRSVGPGTQVNNAMIVNQSGGRVSNRLKTHPHRVRLLDGARYAHRHGIKCSPVRVPKAGFN